MGTLLVNKKNWLPLVGLMIVSAAHGQSSSSDSGTSNNAPVGGGFETLDHQQIHDLVVSAQKNGLVPDSLRDAVVENVSVRNQIEQAKEQKLKVEASKAELDKQQQAAADACTALEKQLSDLNHADLSKMARLKAEVADPNTKLDVKIAAAHQFVWSFPKSAILPDAQAILATLNKQDADEKQAAADLEEKRKERMDFLIKGAQEHNLLIEDWREFLRNMTQDNVLMYLGAPTKKGLDGNWYYSGGWTLDPATQQRSGLVLFFNGTRVLNVSVSEE